VGVLPLSSTLRRIAAAQPADNDLATLPYAAHPSPAVDGYQPTTESSRRFTMIKYRLRM